MLISIIMPVFNGGKFLRTSIQSVLAQEYEDWELIAIDDGSTDDSPAILESYAQSDNRIKVLHNVVNKGIAFSRNRGLSCAKGEYISFLDCDDYWDKKKLTVQFDFMRAQGLDITYMCYVRLKSDRGTRKLVIPPKHASFEALLRGNFIGLSTAMVRRDAALTAQFEKFRHEDYLYWLRVLANDGMFARLVQTTEALVFYNVHGESISAQKFAAVQWQWRIYREALRFGLVRSAYLLACYAINAVKKRI